VILRGASAPVRAALYARQSVQEDQGIAQQLADTRAEARRRGWLVVSEYVDNDTSGSRQRGAGTGWGRMLSAFDAGEFEALIVTETSRLTRALSDVLEVRPPKRDVRIIVTRQGIDTNIDDFALKQLVLIAEHEVKLKADRAARYAAERRAGGHPSSGLTPYGYRWLRASERGPEGTRFAVVEDEAEVVRRIFAEYLAGSPMGQIARDLNAAGYRTRRNTNWRATTVRRILMNPVYAALLAPSQPTGEFSLASIDLDACVPGAWEPIVDKDRVVAARARLVGAKPLHSGTARKWLLSGLALCAVCSEPVRSAAGETHPTARVDGSGRAPSLRYHAYRCPRGHFHRSGDIIDEFVTGACISYIATEDLLAHLQPPEGTRDLATLDGLEKDLANRQATIANLIAQGMMTEANALDALATIRAEQAVIADERKRATRGNPLAELAFVNGLAEARTWWDQASLGRRRSVLDAIMTVKIKPVGAGRRVRTLDAASETLVIELKQ